MIISQYYQTVYQNAAYLFILFICIFMFFFGQKNNKIYSLLSTIWFDNASVADKIQYTNPKNSEDSIFRVTISRKKNWFYNKHTQQHIPMSAKKHKNVFRQRHLIFSGSSLDAFLYETVLFKWNGNAYYWWVFSRTKLVWIEC